MIEKEGKVFDAVTETKPAIKAYSVRFKDGTVKTVEMMKRGWEKYMEMKRARGGFGRMIAQHSRLRDTLADLFVILGEMAEGEDWKAINDAPSSLLDVLGENKDVDGKKVASWKYLYDLESEPPIPVYKVKFEDGTEDTIEGVEECEGDDEELE